MSEPVDHPVDASDLPADPGPLEGDEQADEQGDEQGAATSGPAPATGHPEVDAVLASTDGLADRPVAEHVEVFESAHDRLRAALADAGNGTDTQPAASVPPAGQSSGQSSGPRPSYPGPRPGPR